MKERHGAAKRGKHSLEYRSWLSMVTRCRFSHYKKWAIYKGVKICDRWLGFDGFINFRSDMGPRPSKSHSLDRFPVSDGDYEPGNCRWATAKQQRDNQKGVEIYTLDGRTLPRHDWARVLGISSNGLRWRIEKWGVQRALTAPITPGRSPKGGPLPDRPWKESV
jgi:hypothetical protein